MTSRVSQLRGLREEFAAVDFAVYGLDGMWRGGRWLGAVASSTAKRVEYVCVGHGDQPSRRPAEPTPDRFVTVLTLPRRDRRNSGDGGFLEPTSPMVAAALAGVGLLEDCWPWHITRELRTQWLQQQSEVAVGLACELDSAQWSPLSLPIEDEATVLRYRESPYGWVLAGEAPEGYVGLYGRGVSPYGLGLTRIEELTEYADREV